MKNRYLIAACVILASVASASAQRMHKRDNCSSMNTPRQECRIDNLNDEQKENLKNERIKFQSDIQTEKNQLGELMAKKRTLETTEPINQNNLDKVLTEINAVKTSMAKKRARHQQAVKSYLTDEQVLTFNQFGNRQGMGKHQGRNNGFACQSKGRNAYGKGQGNMNGKGQGNKKGGRGQGNFQGQGRRGQGDGKYANSILSDELQAEFKSARLELMKQQQPLNNQLNELRAQYQTLTSGKSADMKKVDKNLDQQANIQLQLAKNQSKHKLAVRSKLNDEQKVWFDQRHSRRMHKGRMN
jgi:Spy/CpxP family protein refolding chaperone